MNVFYATVSLCSRGSHLKQGLRRAEWPDWTEIWLAQTFVEALPVGECGCPCGLDLRVLNLKYPHPPKEWATILFVFNWREGERNIDLLLHLLMHRFFCVPWPGIRPSTLVYLGDALTDWAAWPGLIHLFLLTVLTYLKTTFGICTSPFKVRFEVNSLRDVWLFVFIFKYEVLLYDMVI